MFALYFFSALRYDLLIEDNVELNQGDLGRGIIVILLIGAWILSILIRELFRNSAVNGSLLIVAKKSDWNRW